MPKPLRPCPKTDCPGDLYPDGIVSWKETEARWVLEPGADEEVCKDVSFRASAQAGKCDTCGRRYHEDAWGGWETPIESGGYYA